MGPHVWQLVAIGDALLSRRGAVAAITGHACRREGAIRGTKICVENIASIPVLAFAFGVWNDEPLSVALRVPLSGRVFLDGCSSWQRCRQVTD